MRLKNFEILKSIVDEHGTDGHLELGIFETIDCIGENLYIHLDYIDYMVTPGDYVYQLNVNDQIWPWDEKALRNIVARTWQNVEDTGL